MFADRWKRVDNYDVPSFWRHFVVCVSSLLLSGREDTGSRAYSGFSRNLSSFFCLGCKRDWVVLAFSVFAFIRGSAMDKLTVADKWHQPFFLCHQQKEKPTSSPRERQEVRCARWASVLVPFCFGMRFWLPTIIGDVILFMIVVCLLLLLLSRPPIFFLLLFFSLIFF